MLMKGQNRFSHPMLTLPSVTRPPLIGVLACLIKEHMNPSRASNLLAFTIHPMVNVMYPPWS